MSMMFLRFLATTRMPRGGQSLMQLRSLDSTVWGSWMKPQQVNSAAIDLELTHVSFIFISWNLWKVCFTLQWLWHMGFTSRTCQPQRRCPGPWCLWISVTQATRFLCVPLTKASWRCVKSQVSISKHLLSCWIGMWNIVVWLFFFFSFAPLGSCNSLWCTVGRKRLWWGACELFLWGVWKEVQAGCKVQAQGSGSSLPGVWKTQKAYECQLLWPAPQYWVFHEWYWRLWTPQQVK